MLFNELSLISIAAHCALIGLNAVTQLIPLLTFTGQNFCLVHKVAWSTRLCLNIEFSRLQRDVVLPRKRIHENSMLNELAGAEVCFLRGTFESCVEIFAV